MKVELISSRGNRCERCKDTGKRLDVHHITYARIFNEEPSDLMLVCRKCHQQIHGLDMYGNKSKGPKITKKKKYSKPPGALIDRIMARQAKGKYKTLKAFDNALRSAKRREAKRYPGVGYKIKPQSESKPVAVTHEMKIQPNGDYKRINLKTGIPDPIK